MIIYLTIPIHNKPLTTYCVKVKVAQVTDSVALSADSGTPSCSGTINVEEDVSNGGKVKIVGCIEGSATVKLLKGTSELASYTVTVPATAGLLHLRPCP